MNDEVMEKSDSSLTLPLAELQLLFKDNLCCKETSNFFTTATPIRRVFLLPEQPRLFPPETTNKQPISIVKYDQTPLCYDNPAALWWSSNLLSKDSGVNPASHTPDRHSLSSWYDQTIKDRHVKWQRHLPTLLLSKRIRSMACSGEPCGRELRW